MVRINRIEVIPPIQDIFIGDFPLSLQVKLLAFLDDKIIFPPGSTEDFLADVRIIAATHRNLKQMVKEGRFRRDLLSPRRVSGRNS